MEGELLLAALVLLLCGPLLGSSAWLPWPGGDRDARGGGALAPERRAWLGLWAPLLPAALAFAMLLGWRLTPSLWCPVDVRTAAAWAHEQAHASRWDPARLWLAGLAAVFAGVVARESLVRLILGMS